LWLTQLDLLAGDLLQALQSNFGGLGMSCFRPYVFALWVSLVTPAISLSQQWLTDNSARGQVPANSNQGLLEPPPPLADLPSSVFDPPNTVDLSEGMSWYKPWTWMPWDGWENSAELGTNGATGNTEALTVSSGARFKRKTDVNLFDLRMIQNRTKSAGLISQNNVLLYADFERKLGGSAWNYFFKQGLEYDELKAFDLRYFLNSGLGYNWIEREGLLFSTRFGAGASREIGGPKNTWTPEALFGSTYDHQINPRNKILVHFDYYPDWTDFGNYRTIANAAWEYLLSEERNLSLKLGGVHRYESRPSGAAKPSDLNYSLMLLYKF
jgi:putative salt-induced outer membrane protein YdiY